ncbi:hypothetical protein [Phosphitispora fastidiosa]|uniref:hypothetical protein n=1 Tax=Phosphitispora fastidiosa TaxID=2837202 RepID=UPI001E4EE173|nr:hypothetical protein [Phosphitispora fastidiosa]MBU7006090.1 hypothetical protein [Phosphitispora fastidiosa]
MKNFLYDFLDPAARQSIDNTHQIQKHIYGVYEPPLLKQLVSLRHLLIRTGYLEADKLNCEELMGLSRIECKMLLKKLNSIYTSQHRKRLPKQPRRGELS